MPSIKNPIQMHKSGRTVPSAQEIAGCPAIRASLLNTARLRHRSTASDAAMQAGSPRNR